MTTKTPTKPAKAAPKAVVKRAPAKPAETAPVPAVVAATIEAAPAVPAVETPVTETIATAAAAAPVAIEKDIKMTETITAAAEKGQAYFADFTAKAKAAAEKGAKSFEEMNEFNKGNIEALVESGKIAAKGFETLGQDYADFARKQFETTTAAFKGFAAVKSPTELVKLHSDYVRGQFDSMVAETSKNTEALIKLAGEVAKPISNRVALAAEKVKIAA